MKLFQLPEFMAASEAREMASRLLPVGHTEGQQTLLATAILYTSWEFSTPSSNELVSVLRAIPGYLLSLPQDAPVDILRISPTRVREAALDAARPVSKVAATLQAAEAWHRGAFASREAYQAASAGLLDWLGVEFGPTAEETEAAEAAMGGLDFSNAVLAPGLVAWAGRAGGTPPTPVPSSPGGSLELYAKSDVLAQWQRITAEDPNPSLRRLLMQMEKGATARTLTPAPEGAALEQLRERFPHFSQVLDFVHQSLALASTGSEGKPVAIAPILLRGTPGTGKSYFAQELAAALACEYQERDLSVTSEAFVLMGVDSTWKNGKPGLVFDALFHGATANPVVCLNEVDKAKETGGSANSPLAALYTLLEPANSKRFKDEFASVNVDASKIVWVLTANDGFLPEPILSRLEVFDIPVPSPSQCRAIARSVWHDLQRKDFPVGHPYPPDLPEELVEQVAVLSPRAMRKALKHAAGLAALAGRAQLTSADLDHALSSRKAPARPLGFLA